MDTLQEDDNVRPRLRFLRDKPSGIAHSQRILPRQVLDELRPLASKMHISSEALLTIIFIGITVVTVIAALGIHLLHKRYHRKQLEHANRLLAAHDKEKVGVGPKGETSSISSALKPPEDSYMVRAGRRSWGGRSCGAPSAVRLDGTEIGEPPNSRSGSPPGGSSNAAASSSRPPHPLRIVYTPSLSSSRRSTAPPSSPTPSQKGKERELMQSPYPPTFTITDDGDFAHHEDMDGSPELMRQSHNYDGEEEDIDLFDEYYQDRSSRLSLASYYRDSVTVDRRSMLFPIKIDDGRHGHKAESTFSIGGLVDMYGSGSPTMGMGSPSSPGGGRFSHSRFSHGTLSPSGRTRRTTWKQPTIAPPRAPSNTSYAFNSQFAVSSSLTSVDSRLHPIHDEPFLERQSSFPSPARSSSSFEHDMTLNYIPAPVPTIIPMVVEQPPPMPMFLSPPPFKAPTPPPTPPLRRKNPLPLVIPSVPSRVPVNGEGTPVRRRLRGMSLHGEILRMTSNKR